MASEAILNQKKAEVKELAEKMKEAKREKAEQAKSEKSEKPAGPTTGTPPANGGRTNDDGDGRED